MPIIRNVKIQNIKNIISRSKVFSINDFRLEFPNSGNILVSIKYRVSSQFLFNIEENQEGNGIYNLNLLMSNKKMVLQTIQKPGKNKNEEIYTHVNIDECINEISSWLANLDEDLKNEIDFEIEDISDIEDFEKKLNEKITSDTEKFSEPEKRELLDKLNEIQERIEKLEQDANSKKNIEIIEQSKSELQTYPKKSWWLKFYNRTRDAKNILQLGNELQNNIMTLLENIKSWN